MLPCGCGVVCSWCPSLRPARPLTRYAFGVNAALGMDLHSSLVSAVCVGLLLCVACAQGVWALMGCWRWARTTLVFSASPLLPGRARYCKAVRVSSSVPKGTVMTLLATDCSRIREVRVHVAIPPPPPSASLTPTGRHKAYLLAIVADTTLPN
jgi:hypothetical protein